MKHSTGTGNSNRQRCSSSVSGDGSVEKQAAKAKRITGGMADASGICRAAIIEAGATEEAFAACCVSYFSRLCKKTDVFSKGGVTFRVVRQFGLACAYMHREGLKVDNVVLFKKLDSFATKLPKTYALTRSDHKVRSITRIQDAIRSLVRETEPERNLRANPGLLDDFVFPEF